LYWLAKHLVDFKCRIGPFLSARNINKPDDQSALHLPVSAIGGLEKYKMFYLS